MIGGNTTISIQTKTTIKNAIGESVETWNTTQSISGWIDLSGGSSDYAKYNTKIQDSTHVFICDYVPLDASIKAENSRIIDDGGKVYDVMLIDDPMNLHKQWEIYLKYTGGQ